MELAPGKLSIAEKIKSMETVSKMASDNSNSDEQKDIGRKPKPLPKPKPTNCAQNTSNFQHENKTISTPSSPCEEPKVECKASMKDELAETFNLYVNVKDIKSIPSTAVYSTEGDYEIPIENRASATEFQDVFDHRIDLLIIGKTCSGKSSLGNSILGCDVFDIAGTPAAVFKDVTGFEGVFKGRLIQVVDGQDFSNMDWDKFQTGYTVVNALSHAIKITPSGYHAILLAMKFEHQFCKEDLDAINSLKMVFGEQFVNKHCILVMTFGDLFQEKLPFAQWLKEQTGVLADIVKECNNRVILFDNKTRDKEKKQKQIEILIELVDKLIFANSRYSNEQLELALSQKDVLILTSKRRVIVDETMKEVGIITQNFKDAKELVKQDNNPTLLEDLLKRTTRLYNFIVDVDKKTGILATLIANIHSIQSSIKYEMNVFHQTREIKDGLDKKYENQIDSLKDEIATLKEKCKKSNTKEKKLENCIVMTKL